MSREYRPLLPAPDYRPVTDLMASAPKPPVEEPPQRKRVGVAVACNLCRSRKTRCDGARPVCSICKKRGIQECVYSNKQGASDETSKIMELLQSETESTAIDILRLLRSNHDLTTVLALIESKFEEDQQRSASSRSLGASAPQNSQMEAELVTKNPHLYPVMHSLPRAALVQNQLLQSANLFPTEPINQKSPAGSSNTRNTNQAPETNTLGYDFDSAIRRFRHPKSPVDLAKDEATLCDEQLSNLDISFWTTVPIPNGLAAKVISLYLATDHPLLGTFEPQQFVVDLVNHRLASCSHFLVNTLLYWGCQMYSAIEKEANDYVEQLSAEAIRLWTVEKSSDSILTMIGAQMLSLAYMGNGKDHHVVSYQIESVRMGTRLGLLGVDEKTAASKLAHVTDDKLNACSFAAWGVFNWAMLVTMFYRQPGLVYLKFPPTLPIPGDSGRGSPQSSSSSPDDKTDASYVFPSYMGNTFPVVCEFWRIMREVSMAYFSANDDPTHHVSLDFAELKYREIMAWAETLPPPALRDVDNPHQVLVLHMWIHAAIVDIFRPFAQREAVEPLRLRTFSAIDRSPAAVCKASINQLKQLIFSYRSNYEESTYSILWQTALTYVATAVLQEKTDPAWRSWFLLCIYGYVALRRPFRITEAIGRALLTITMRDTDMTSSKARKLLDELKAGGLPSAVEEEIRATFIGDLRMAETDPEGAKMENLAKDFDEMAFFNDVITTPDDVEMTT